MPRCEARGDCRSLFKPGSTNMSNVAHFMCELVTNPKAWADWKVSCRSSSTFDALNLTIVRGVLTAVLWLQPMSQRYEVCSTRKEADEWCRKWVLTPTVDPATSVHG